MSAPILELDQLATTLGRLQLPVPQRLQNVLATFHAVQRAANSDVAEDLRARVEAEELDATNVVEAIEAAAARMAAKSFSHGLMLDIEKPLSRVARRAMREEGDAVVVALRPTFDEAVAAVRAAVEVVGTNPDGATIAELGPSAISAWSRGEQGSQTLNNVRRAVRAIYAAVDHTVDHTAFVVDPRNSAKLKQIGTLYNSGGGIIGLARSDVAMRLNTVLEARAMVDSAAAADAAAAEQVREQQRAVAREQAAAQRQREGWADTDKLPVRPSGKARR